MYMLISSTHTHTHTRLLASRRHIMFSKPVLLDQLQLRCEFDPHCVPYTFGLVSHLSYALKTTIGLVGVSSSLIPLLFTRGRSPFTINTGRLLASLSFLLCILVDTFKNVISRRDQRFAHLWENAIKHTYTYVRTFTKEQTLRPHTNTNVNVFVACKFVV